MTRQSQWLFETPLAPEATHYTNSYINPEEYEEEWEATKSANRGKSRNFRSNRPIIIRTASLPPLKDGGIQGRSALAEDSKQPLIQLTGFPPTPLRRGTIPFTHFSVGSDRLSATHLRMIRKTVKEAIALMPKMQPLSTLVIDIEGHEDETGDPARFASVGFKRAVAVAKVLAEELKKAMNKVNSANLRNVEIKVSSAGPTRPIRSNVTPEGRALNRRVEIRMKQDTSRVI